MIEEKAQVIEMVHAVALTQETRAYRVHYLQIPRHELGKYLVTSELQDLAIAEAKMTLHFKREVVKL